jgi:hypothetical protein
VDVAYFTTPGAALAAWKHLVAVTQAAARRYHVEVTSARLHAALRVKGVVVYWWPEETFGNQSDVQHCLRS